MVLSLLFFLFFDVTCSYDFSENVQECITSQRVIGGVCTPITKRPFQALILIYNEPKCGASIISNRWILTAAHCVHRIPNRNLVVEVGSSKVKGHTAQYYKIDKTIVHENYFTNGSMVQNDIALLRTSECIRQNSRVRAIPLNTIPPDPGATTIVSGYGVTKVHQLFSSEYLMAVDVKVIEIGQCKSILKQIEPQLVIPYGTFCAGHLEGGKDACQGDSGGPITIGNTLAGIVSWGLDCAEKMMPGFYTDVSYYINWIARKMHRYARTKKSRTRIKLISEKIFSRSCKKKKNYN